MHKIRFPLPSILFFAAVIAFDRTGSTSATLLAAFIHELGHLVTIRWFGIGIKNIVILPYGLEIRTEKSAPSFKSEIFISLAGCIANFVCFFIFAPFGGDLRIFAESHLILGFLNLMPVLGLDGGSALYSFISLFAYPDKTTAICNKISFITLILLWIWAVYIFMFSTYNYSLFIMCIWLFAKIFCSKN